MTRSFRKISLCIWNHPILSWFHRSPIGQKHSLAHPKQSNEGFYPDKFLYFKVDALAQALMLAAFGVEILRPLLGFFAIDAKFSGGTRL